MDDQAKQQSDKAAEKAAREAAWWAQWREQDFSWAGLAALDARGQPKHRWIGWSVSPGKRCVETADAPNGSRPATLQDYFRWDPETCELRSDQALRNAGLLIEDTGQAEFHILHLPETHADSTASFKADLDAAGWGVLEAEVSRCLAHSGATDKAVGTSGFKGADHRAQFTGAVLRRFPRPPAPAKDEQALPQLHLCADLCAWLRDVDARRIDCASPLSMATALFKGDADFTEAQFSGGDASFYQAQFSGGDAYFSAILALGDVNLARGELSGTEAGELRHSNAPGDTSARASEGTTQSGHDVSQIWLTTPGARAEAGALAGFKLGNARIFGTADFSDRVFSSEPDFEGVKFFGRSSFHGVSLHEGVRWKMARFRFGTPMRPRRFPVWDKAWRQALATARSWLGRQAPHAPDHIPFPSREALWDEIERRAGDTALPDKAREQFDATYDRAKARFDDRGLEADLYESDYRTLKRLSAKIGASTEEQRFFALELKARQARRLTRRGPGKSRDTDVTAWEAVFARLYGAVTDYGQSLTRVLGWMGVVWLASAASDLALAVTAPPLPAPQAPVALHQTPRLIGAQEVASPPDDRWTAYWHQEGRTGLLGPALYGLEMTVVPVVNPGGHHPWTRRLEGPDAGGHVYWFALVRLIHRLLALPLAFLFLLTLRRRFQIS